jgi:alkylation response protein AidB-like acyl-CoA dehydrogenase
VNLQTLEIEDSISAKTAREWVERARALKPLLEASAAEIEKSRTIPNHVLDALHDAQMFRTVMPRSVGGAELDPATHAQVVAAIAEGDASVAWCIAQAACASMACSYLEPRVAQEIFADPRALFTFGSSTEPGPSAAGIGLQHGSVVIVGCATRRATSSSARTAAPWSGL